MNQVECNLCGTVYRGKAIEELRMPERPSWFERDSRGVWTFVACLCQHDGPFRTHSYMLRRYLKDQQWVLAQAATDYHPNKYLVKPVSKDENFLWATKISDCRLLAFSVHDGCERDGVYVLSSEELKLALEMVP